MLSNLIKQKLLDSNINVVNLVAALLMKSGLLIVLVVLEFAADFVEFSLQDVDAVSGSIVLVHVLLDLVLLDGHFLLKVG